MVSPAILADAAVFLGSVLALWLGARTLVDAAVRLAHAVGLSGLVVGLTVVAAGTSAPEIVVSADAAAAGLGAIAVGNVVGSNLFNLAAVLGSTALVRAIATPKRLVRRDGAALVAGTLLALAFLWDGRLTRLEGAALVSAYAAYVAVLVRRESASERDAAAAEHATDARPRDLGLLALGLALVLAGGHFLVVAASDLARTAGVSEWVVGATVVAAGTSTPEFAVSAVAVRRGRVGVSVGNVVGSNLFNLLPVLGIAALVRPLSVAATATPSLLWLLALTVLVVGALGTQAALSRLEGGLLVLSEAVRWLVNLTG